VVRLEPLTEANRAELVALELDERQLRFVNTVAEALEEADGEPGGRAIRFGLYDGAAPVGFVMISDEVDGPGYIAHYLWKLIVDVHHQRADTGRRRSTS